MARDNIFAKDVEDEVGKEVGNDEALLDPAETAEEIPSDSDAPMESDGSEGEDDGEGGILQEVILENDSVAHFDAHKDSIFCITQHPVIPELVATGGGDDLAYVFDSTPPERPVLPASYQSSPQTGERRSLTPLAKLEGHTDSVNGITFTLPKGEYVVSVGLDGRLRAYKDSSKSGDGRAWAFVADAQEVQEINWILPCPHSQHPNTIALGASDGSVWVYTVNAEDKATPLTIVQVYYLHTDTCTAGAWSPDGRLLASISEDGSLHVCDVFGEAAAAGSTTGQSLVAITAQDQRFAIEGGLYSVAISPTGTLAVVGGAGGQIRVVGLPKIGTDQSKSTKQKASMKPKSGGDGTSSGPTTATSSSQAGQILASLQSQSDSIETLAFSTNGALLASGSIDGSIALFDTGHQFALRRHIQAHDEHATVKVEFVRGNHEWLLTSAGMDGVVRRWDTRGGAAVTATQGLVKELKGHRGGGEGGGVLGFVQSGTERIVTAGDE